MRLPVPPLRHSIFLEATPRFELGIKALQAHALPLGYVAVVPGAGLEPARKKKIRGILSPLRLPIPPPGHFKILNKWSGKRESNSRHRPWQGRALPLSYSRIMETEIISK